MLMTPFMHVDLLGKYQLIDVERAEKAICAPTGRLSKDDYYRNVESPETMVAIDAMSAMYGDGYRLVDRNTLETKTGRKEHPYDAIRDALRYVFEKYEELGRTIDRASLSESIIMEFLYKYFGCEKEESK